MNTLKMKLQSGDADISRAAEILRNGGLVGVPTETVYGLAANGLDEAAVQKIYEVKGRPETKPISLLVSDIEQASEFCRDIPEKAARLTEKFWPGPLTVILMATERVSVTARAGGMTVGLRCPDHPVTLELIRLAGLPLAAPSANISGEPSPKCAADVETYFDGKIECIIDGGVCRLGIESTIVDFTVEPPRILRQGGLSRESIEAVIGKVR